MAYNYSTGQTQTLSSIINYSTVVSGYDSVNKIVYLQDPVNISLGYNTVLGTVASTYNFIGANTVTLSESITQGTKVPGLSTDETGTFHGIFNVPTKTFQTGARVFRVDDRDVIEDPTTASCYAEATFTASGLSVMSNNPNFSPSVDSSSTTFTSVAATPSTLISTITTYCPYDPIAQSFMLDPKQYPNGAFLKSIKIFFSKKPILPSPVTLYIVPTINGTPAGAALAYSTVTLHHHDIITPDVDDNGNKVLNKLPYYTDSNTYTEFEFSAPVYVQPGVLFAFIVKAKDPDYKVYLAEQGKPVANNTAGINNTNKLVSTPAVGCLFESQNAITWTSDQTKELMFIITQCMFDTSNPAQIEFNVVEGLPYRKLGRNDIQHSIDPTCVSNLMGNFSQNKRSDAYNITTTDVIPTSTGISYTYSSTLAQGNVPVGPYPVSPGKFGCPTLVNIPLNDNLGERILLKSSNNSFSLSATLSSTDANVSPILSDDGISLYNISYMINNMGIQNNVVALANSGIGYSSNISFVVSAPDIGYDTAAISANLSSNGAISSAFITYPGSGYLTSPTVQIFDPSTRIANGKISTTISTSIVTGANTTFLTNLTANSELVTSNNDVIGTILSIANNTSLTLVSNSAYTITSNTFYTSTPRANIIIHGETGSSGGNSYAKYITKKVVLTPGNDSGDLRVYYTAYKPVGTGVYVYYKILSSNDNSDFDSGSWQLMTQLTGTSKINSSGFTDMIEFECAPGTNGIAANEISYTNADDITYTSFIQFSIKIVLAASDYTDVPSLSDIRALALPPGTHL